MITWAFARIGNKQAVSRLFDVLGQRYKERPGGYTQIFNEVISIKYGFSLFYKIIHQEA